jgi:hypothetical protein
MTPWAINIFFYAPPNSLKNSNVPLKLKTTKEERIRVQSLAHNTTR